MKILKVSIQILILLCFSAIGIFLQTVSNIPIPGSIIGFLLLLLSLSFKLIPVSWINLGADSLLLFLPVFLIPSTLGIIKSPVLFTAAGLSMMLVVLLSTVFTMVASGLAGQIIEGKKGEEKWRDF